MPRAQLAAFPAGLGRSGCSWSSFESYMGCVPVPYVLNGLSFEDSLHLTLAPFLRPSAGVASLLETLRHRCMFPWHCTNLALA